jgi:hypothetical protein
MLVRTNVYFYFVSYVEQCSPACSICICVVYFYEHCSLSLFHICIYLCICLPLQVLLKIICYIHILLQWSCFFTRFFKTLNNLIFINIIQNVNVLFKHARQSLVINTATLQPASTRATLSKWCANWTPTTRTN